MPETLRPKFLRHLTILAICGLFLSSQTVWGADANGVSSLHGMGGVSCKVITGDERFRSDAYLKGRATEWISGYLTALNAATPNVFEFSPVTRDEDLFRLVYAKCSENIALNLQQATQRVINILAPARLASASPLVILKNEFGEILIRENNLIIIQDFLKKNKMFEGYSDGKPTPAIIEAIRKFQAANSLPKTGLPDYQTVIKILIEPYVRKAETTKR
jgi:hypothetical protein